MPVARQCAGEHRDGFRWDPGRVSGPADITRVARDTISVATLSARTTLTITCRLTMNSSGAIADHAN